jgi:hypothetical protein
MVSLINDLKFDKENGRLEKKLFSSSNPKVLYLLHWFLL